MVQRYNILGRYTNQYLCLCSHAWSVEVSHGKIRVRQRGILVKVLGKCTDENFLIKNGEPFYKDEKVEAFNYDKYYGYRIPATHELKEVLDIIRQDHTLLADFKKASMPIHLDSTFWVRDTARKYLFKKKLQYYDASTDECMVAGDGDAHWRLTIVYFYKSEINW